MQGKKFNYIYSGLQYWIGNGFEFHIFYNTITLMVIIVLALMSDNCCFYRTE